MPTGLSRPIAKNDRFLHRSQQARNPVPSRRIAGLLFIRTIVVCAAVNLRQSRSRPSREIVTTCQGMNLPLALRAFCAAR